MPTAAGMAAGTIAKTIPAAAVTNAWRASRRGRSCCSLFSLSFHLPNLLPNAQERVPAKNKRENRREHSPHVIEGSILEEWSDEVRGLDEHHTEKERACDEITDLPSFERHYGAKKPQDRREKTGERHHQVRSHRKR